MSTIVEYSLNRAVSVTPNDTNLLTFPSGENRTKAVYVGVTGDLAVTMADGNDVLLKGVVAGVVHFLSVRKVKATGTTATDIVVLF